MLTVLRSKGDNTVRWCGFRVPGFETGNVGARYSSFVGPLPFRLPPTDGHVYNITDYGFGLQGDEIPLGFLESKDSSYGRFKPCSHLDAKGTIVYYNNKMPSFGLGSFASSLGNQPAYLSPSTASQRVYSFYGAPVPQGRGRYWKLDGSSGLGSGSEYADWMYCSMPIGNKSPAGGVPYVSGMRVYGKVGAYSFDERYWDYQLSIKLSGLSTFKFQGDAGDWTKPGTDRGSHFLFDGTYTVSKIRGNANGTFSIYGSYKHVLKTYYVDNSGNVTWQPDKVVTHVGWRALHIIAKDQVPLAEVDLDIASLDRSLHSYVLPVMSHYSEKVMHATRVKAVADITALKSNNLENISGLKGSLSIITTLKDAYAAVKKGDVKAGARALAGAYLWYSYALAPTVSDSKDIVKNTGKITRTIASNPFSNERRRARTIVTDYPDIGKLEYCVTYHTRLEDKYYAQLYEGLMRFGLHPSVSQMWDFIPFSFVVDWFTEIGPTLERLSAYNSFALLRNVVARIESYKGTRTYGHRVSDNPSMYQFIGTYEESYYRRSVHSNIGTYDPFIGQDSSGIRSSQMLQGAALLVQQLD